MSANDKKVWSSNQNQFYTENKNKKELPLLKDTEVFIYNKNTKEHVTFNIIPDSLQESYRPKFISESNIYGRTTPLYFYSGGEDRTVAFSFIVHEDLLPKSSVDTHESITNFLEVLKKFSRSVSDKIGKDQTLIAPEVYLQIGRQFAGSGHLQTQWQYGLPYRNGRYIVTEISITFTYYIEHKSPEIDLKSPFTILSGSDTTEQYKLSTDMLGKLDDKMISLLDLHMDYGAVVKNAQFFDISLQSKTNDRSYVNLYNNTTRNQIEKALDKGVQVVKKDIWEADATYSVLDISNLNYGLDWDPFNLMLDYLFLDLTLAVHPSLPLDKRLTALKTIASRVSKIATIQKETEGSYRIFDNTIYTQTNAEKKLFNNKIQELGNWFKVYRILLEGGKNA